MLPRLEGVGSVSDECCHALYVLVVDEVVAVEQCLVIGEDGMSVGGDVDVLIEPVVGLRIIVGIGRCRCYEKQVVVFQQCADGFLRRALRLLPLVDEGADGDVDDGAFPTLLAVVYPSDDGHDGVHEAMVVHAVLAVESHGLRIVLAEQVVGVDCGVGVAEESPYVLFLLAAEVSETAVGDVLVFLDECFCHDKLLYAVFPSAAERLRPYHAMFFHGVAHLQCGIDKYAMVSVQHLRVHASH